MTYLNALIASTDVIFNKKIIFWMCLCVDETLSNLPFHTLWLS